MAQAFFHRKTAVFQLSQLAIEIHARTHSRKPLWLDRIQLRCPFEAQFFTICAFNHIQNFIQFQDSLLGLAAGDRDHRPRADQLRHDQKL